MARRIWINVESPVCATVRGHGSRALLVTVTGRPPLWSNHSRAWMTTERNARDVVAAGERAGFDVIITGTPSRRLAPSTPAPEPNPETEPAQELW